MFIYWLMFLIPASIALFVGGSRKSNSIPWITIGFFFILVIGLRHQVGCDWTAYLHHYTSTIGTAFSQAVGTFRDPGHQFINWLMARLDLGVHAVNVIYGTVFIIGLIKFSREQVYPWIAMTVAVPYLITVVIMGYSRQGIAIGLFLLAVTYLNKRKFKTYVFLIIIAALFHKTVILLLPFGIFLYGKGIALRILMIIPVAYGVWDLLIAERQEALWKNYVDAQMQSQGAMIRVAMNLVPALLLLIYRKEWKRSFDDYAFWFWIAIGSIISVALVDFASTAVDRIALYFIPIQLVVFARLPYLARKRFSPAVMKVMIVLGYAFVYFVWLNFASHAHCWIPYKNIIFMDIT